MSFTSGMALDLYPTVQEFADPINYLSKPEIIELGEKFGILKIVPPETWKPSFSIDKKTFKFHTRLQKLSNLSLVNRSRTYFLKGFKHYLRSNNIRFDRKFNGFFKINSPDTTITSVNIHDIFVNKSFDDYTKLISNENDKRIFNYLIKYSSYYDEKLINKNNETLKHKTILKLFDDNEGNIIDFLGLEEAIYENKKKNSCSLCHLENNPYDLLACHGCDFKVHLTCLLSENPLLNSDNIFKNNWFCENCLIGLDCDYGFEEDFDEKFTLIEFEKYCEELMESFKLKNNINEINIVTIENEFWRLVDNKNKGILDNSDFTLRYGADINKKNLNEVSGFPTSQNSFINKFKELHYINHNFNLTKLPFSNGSLLNFIDKRNNKNLISGMTIPWIYIGSPFSTFCWHKEDHYTLSANYCHEGAIKKWYGIPSKFNDNFEKICEKHISPDYFKKQPDLLHQLITLISPEEIRNYCNSENGNEKIEIYEINQKQGEFVITFPKVYHAGFNAGFNINEAVNFTMPYWIKYGNESINDYKGIQKENVFNFFKLLKNLIDSLLSKESDFKDLNFLNYCFYLYCKEIRKFSELLNDESFSRLHSSFEIKKFIDSEEEEEEDESMKEKNQNKKEATYDQEGEDSDYDSEDESQNDDCICADCKTYVNFQWIVVDAVNDFKDQIGTKIEKLSELNKVIKNTSFQLPTPENSPEEKQEPIFGNENTMDYLVRGKRRRSMGTESRRTSLRVKSELKNENGNENENANENRNGNKIRKSNRLMQKQHKIEIFDLTEEIENDDVNYNYDEGATATSNKINFKRRLLSTLTSKRNANKKFGKFVLCMNCFKLECDTLDELQLERLSRNSYICEEYSLKDLEHYVCEDVLPKLKQLSV